MMVATKNSGLSGRFLAPILCVTGLAATVAGCQQPTANSAAGKPEIAAVANADPVMLSGAAFTTGSIPADGGPAAGAAPAASALAPVPESAPPAAPAPQAPPPQTAIAATPLPPPGQPAPSANPTGAPVAAVRPDGYPNINIAPQEPGGKLLSPEERAKLIAELNALAGRDSGGQ